ncbi:hypothetical protein BDV25DRAFT_162442 [Aspergillus avenaceus]|uniref:Uncharacterized protein n=1 Tax=Aspergillus avenaceus TaxID=36643 RepID=A0A5N6TJD0_ASPAV|nr:hypothetical protein BDV25DRAFT_162442 [Aspergillus avenaceus]
MISTQMEAVKCDPIGNNPTAAAFIRSLAPTIAACLSLLWIELWAGSENAVYDASTCPEYSTHDVAFRKWGGCVEAIGEAALDQ